VVIPAGLTGWGADPVAPFHGFTVFLAGRDKLISCIRFDISLRVDLGEPGESPYRPNGARPVKVGNITGWRVERTGQVNGTVLKNVLITYSVRRKGEEDEGSVWLVTPAKDFQKHLPIFEKFISQIRFGDVNSDGFTQSPSN
jgi:hypothetical protein